MVVRKGFIEKLIFEQRLEGGEGASWDSLWNKTIPGRGHTVCKRIQLKAQCGAHLSDDVNLVSLSIFQAMQGNLLSPVTEDICCGSQAQQDSGAEMMTSAFCHFYFSLWYLHSQGRIFFSALSSKNPRFGCVLGWCVSCDHPWPHHWSQGDGMIWLTGLHSWAIVAYHSLLNHTDGVEEMEASLKERLRAPVRRVWRLDKQRPHTGCFSSWALFL